MFRGNLSLLDIFLYFVQGAFAFFARVACPPKRPFEATPKPETSHLPMCMKKNAEFHCDRCSTLVAAEQLPLLRLLRLELNPQRKRLVKSQAVKLKLGPPARGCQLLTTFLGWEGSVPRV